MTYTNQELKNIAEHYRKQIKPTTIKQISDIKKFPNDILISYLLPSENLNREELSSLLANFKNLEKKLKEVLKEKSEIELQKEVELEMSIYGFNLIGLEEKFHLGYSENRLIFSDKIQKKYKYPSGRSIEYFSLTNEMSANISILDFGYGFGYHDAEDEIYIRENFVAFMLAYMDCVKKEPEFTDYQEQIQDFEKNITGIIIAHELCDLMIHKQKDLPKENEKKELLAEHNAKKLLAEERMDLKNYELFHLLRATQNKKEKNISKIIVERNFQPIK